MARIEALLEALNKAAVRYVVGGGVAVVLHGHARLTVDVDLVVDLEEREARKAIDALLSLGLRSQGPVDPAGFADASLRAQWAGERGMRVFSMSDPGDPLHVVDLFVTHPIPFEEIWSRSVLIPLSRVHARVASIPDLIRMKRLAGRPWDATWEGARQRTLEAVRAATPAQRLEWLEEVQELALLSGAISSSRGAGGGATESARGWRSRRRPAD